MTLSERVDQYVKTCLTIPHDRSQEYYFGENNSLRCRLIDWIDNLRAKVKEAANGNDNFLPKDALPILKKESLGLSKIICEEFNVEGCTVGWINQINACCYSHLSNSDIYTAKDEARMLRVKLNDIIDTSTGFKYKNKKGIFYVIAVGYPIFAVDAVYTSEEAAAILVHELGHAMQHIVNSFNEMATLTMYESLYRIIKNEDDNRSLDSYSPAAQKNIKKMFKTMRRLVKNNDKAGMKKFIDTMFDSYNDYDGTSYSNMTDDKIQGILEEDYHSDWELDTNKYMDKKVEEVAARRNKLGYKIKNFFRSIFSTLTFWAYIPMIVSRNSKSKNPELNQFKVFEETADDFSQIYGLGVAQASVQKKFATNYENLRSYHGGALERVPMLDLFYSLKEIRRDYDSAVYGYPTNRQRMINQYAAAKFELQNNKELTPTLRAELTKQIEEYKAFYDDFVALDSKKGWFYRLVSGLNRTSLETEAAKDPYIYKHVLIPLQSRMDPKFDPDKEYADIMNNDKIK